MMDDIAGLALVQSHVQRSQHQLGAQVIGHRPADDAPCAGIEDHGQKQKPRPGRDIGDIGHVELIGLSGHEVALNQIRRRPRIGSSSGRCDPLAPADTI